MRHTTFRLALAPTPVQAALLARHAGASRFAYNQCLRLVTDALAAQKTDPRARVPWSGFDLINAFNAWKVSEAAGRVFVVTPDGTVTKRVTGLVWRHEVSAQVFEEAAVDLGRALAAYDGAKRGKSKGRVGFPRRKRKSHSRDSFRLRNKKGGSATSCIRVGQGHKRSVTLPTIGTVRVHDHTRRLRRLLRPADHTDPDTGQMVQTARAKVLFATISWHGDRWYVSLNVQAPDLHPPAPSPTTRFRRPCRLGRAGPRAGRVRGRRDRRWYRGRPLPGAQAAYPTASPAPAPLPSAFTRSAALPQPRQGRTALVPPARSYRRYSSKLPPRGLQPARPDPRSAVPRRKLPVV